MNDNKYEEALSKASKELSENDLESLDFYKDIKYVEPDFNVYKDNKKTNRFSRLTLAAAVLILILSVSFAIWISKSI